MRYNKEKYHASSVIQDFVFLRRKRCCISCISLQVYNKLWNLISWLHQKPADLDLPFFQKKVHGVKLELRLREVLPPLKKSFGLNFGFSDMFYTSDEIIREK